MRRMLNPRDETKQTAWQVALCFFIILFNYPGDLGGLGCIQLRTSSGHHLFLLPFRVYIDTFRFHVAPMRALDSWR